MVSNKLSTTPGKIVDVAEASEAVVDPVVMASVAVAACVVSLEAVAEEDAVMASSAVDVDAVDLEDGVARVTKVDRVASLARLRHLPETGENTSLSLLQNHRVPVTWA